MYWKDGFSVQNSPIPPPNADTGIFETFLIRQDKSGLKVLELAKHLARLVRSANALRLRSPSIEGLFNEISNHLFLIQKETKDAIAYRLVLNETGTIHYCAPFIPRYSVDEGCKIGALNAVRPTPEIKSCNCSTSLQAIKAAKESGLDEMILLDESNIIRECAWANIFWIDQNNCLHTPQTGMLPGITRSVVLEIASSEFSISFDDTTLDSMLSTAKEIFITQSLHGIVPVARCCGVDFSIGETTRMITALYEGEWEVF